MKKRIISALLVIVMSVMALASCAPAFNFAHDDLSGYVTFNYEKFKEELQKIEIEDGDFTTTEATRLEKVKENIFSSIASAVIKNAIDSDKKETGKIGNNDVVYYCYYATDAAGNVYFFSNMKESAITATSTKADHVIELGSYDTEDELKKLIAEKLLNGENDNFDFGTADAKLGYDMKTSADLDNDRVATGDKIVISYKRSYKYNNDANEIKEVCTFELADMKADSQNPIVKHIAELLAADEAGKAADANYKNKLTINVGSTVKYKDANNAEISEFKIPGTVKIENVDTDVEFVYSSVKVEYKVANMGTELTFDYAPYDKDTKVTPDNLHLDSTAGQVEIKKDAKLTYHVFPVYYISIPDITADSILEHIVAKNITDTYFDAFEGNYKNGEEGVAALVAEIKALFNEEYKTGDSAPQVHKDLKDLKDKVTAAEAALKEKGDKALQEDRDKVTEAKNAYTLAQREAIKAAVAKLTAAVDGENKLSDAIVKEYEKDTYDKLEDEYEKHITEAVEKKVYELIFENDEICKINAEIVYPEKLLKEFKKHLYESYEHEFYNGSYSTSSTNKESNYKHYAGDLQKYLYVATKAEELFGKTEGDKEKAIDMAIEKEAKEAIDPLLKLYAVARALDADGVVAKVEEYIDKDILAGAYKARYEDNKNLTEKQNEEAREVAEKNAKKNEESAKENASYFLITDEVFKDYKKEIGSSAYRSYEEQYGEINIRASLQFNRLFYYLTSTDLVDNIDENKTDIAYSAEDGGVIVFRTIKYILVEDDGLDHEAEADGTHDHDGDGTPDH